jgi:hypothetical protein
LEEANGGRTEIGPMVARHAMAREFETRQGIFAVSMRIPGYMATR